MSNTAGSVTIVLSADQTSFSASLTEAQRQLDKFANKASAAGHGTVSGMQAASASIRLLENPLGNNMRAIERLISQSKVLSSVMKAAFPLVGAIAIGGMIAKLGKEVYEFVQKVNAMPAAIKTGFDGLHTASLTSIDDMQLVNDKLRNAHALFEHKPQNMMAIAIDEARIASDKWAVSLQNDANKIKEIFSNNQIGALGILMGKAGTGVVTDKVNQFQTDIASLGYQRNIKVHDGDQAGADALSKQIDAKRLEALNWSKSQLQQRDNPGSFMHRLVNAPIEDQDAFGDQASNRNILLGFQSTMVDTNASEKVTKENGVLTHQHEQDEAAKAAREAAKKAAAEALAAQRKAAQEQLHEWENENSDWKAEEDRSLRQDAAWWSAKLATLNTGSLNYREINKKVNADIIADNRQWANQVAEFTKSYLSEGNKTSWVTASDTANIDAQGKATVEWITALRQGVDLQKQNADAMAESSLQMAVAIGNMTRLDAAQALANIHTQQYTAQMDALQDARQSVEDNSSLTDLERKAQLAQSDNAIAALKANRAQQAQQDNEASNPKGSSASVGFVGALDEFVIASKDAANQMRELATGTLASLNAEILKGITGGKTDFKSVGAGLAKNVAGVGLQKAEGSILGALGFGSPKADGSKGSPLYVRMADSISGAAGPIGSAVSAGGSGFFQSLLHSFLPGFANGGAVSPGTLAMVGERGPELAYFGSGASITPNHQLSTVGSGSGGDAYYNISVPNGVTPEAMHMFVSSALQQYHPKGVQAAVTAVQGNRSRQPTSSR